MQPADIFESKNLATNALHYRALAVASRMADLMKEKKSSNKYQKAAEELKAAINSHLWLPEKNYYGQYLYGRHNQILSPRSEALGEALCVVFDVADPARQKKIVQSVPLVEYGIPCIFPQISDVPPYHNNAVWPFVQTYWLWAAAKAGNEKSVLHSIASIFRASAMFLTNKENFVADNGDHAGTQINSSNMLWSLSGNISLIHKVLFGISFEENNLRFAPFVPKVMSAARTLTNFKYRKSVLDIELNGYGNRIASFVLDGKLKKTPLFPAKLTGKHSVKITLANNDFENQPINLTNNEFTPLMPIAKYDNGKLSWMPIAEIKGHRVLKNGQDWKETTATSLEISKEESGEFQVMAVAKNDISSFASEPIQIFPETRASIYEAEKFLPPSSLPYLGFSGTGFVEITRRINRVVSLDINVPAEGLYAIDWRYANGNGPTNTENKCAIRTLFLDNARVGAQIFPQRGAGEWSNWGFSNAIKVHLTSGNHKLKLEFMPENENMNIEVNQAMLDSLRLIKIE
jgi:hypothetical protein